MKVILFVKGDVDGESCLAHWTRLDIQITSYGVVAVGGFYLEKNKNQKLNFWENYHFWDVSKSWKFQCNYKMYNLLTYKYATNAT